MYRYLFGPVPSRRLGVSLGVDLVTHKICSLDCVYCECGPTTDLTLERKEYVPVDEVLKELEDYFTHHPDPDYVTFSGSGEPTLNSRIGEVIRYIKQRKPLVKVAVLTNGTLLGIRDVQQDLLPADLVIPSLDAVSPDALERINRPSSGVDAQAYCQGLESFRKQYTGRVHLEVFVLPGVNTDPGELALLKEAAVRIRPDVIQLNTLDRPGAVPDIRAATPGELEAVADVFRDRFQVEIIASGTQRKTLTSYRQDMESAILETIRRRPCTVEDLAVTLGTRASEVNKYLTPLESDGRIESVRLPRGLFYQTRDRS